MKDRIEVRKKGSREGNKERQSNKEKGVKCMIEYRMERVIP
jgi:hypothetical protein